VLFAPLGVLELSFNRARFVDLCSRLEIVGSLLVQRMCLVCLDVGGLLSDGYTVLQFLICDHAVMCQLWRR